MSSVPAPPAEPNPILAFLRARWLSVLVFILVVVFIAMNRHEVTISLPGAQIAASLWVVLTVVLVAGWIIGAVRTRRQARGKR